MEKIIEGLQEIQKGFLQLAKDERTKSPERSYQNFMRAEACRKAIRELERIKPEKPEVEGGGYSWFYVCPECRKITTQGEKFCQECGKALIWK